MTTQGSRTNLTRTPIETALRYLGARRYGNLVERIEYAILRPGGHAGKILEPLTSSTSILRGWTSAERAQALWKIIEVSSSTLSRRRRALQAASAYPTGTSTRSGERR